MEGAGRVIAETVVCAVVGILSILIGSAMEFTGTLGPDGWSWSVVPR